MTLKELIEKFEFYIDQFPSLFSSKQYGAYAEFTRDQEILYPAVFIERPSAEKIDISNNTTQMTCALVFSDRSLEDMSNRIQILSKLRNSALILLKSMQQREDVDMTNVSFLLSEEEGNDRVYYIRAEFDITLQFPQVCLDAETYDHDC